LFRSFWQGGFECSTHVLANGKRLDVVASTLHDQFAPADFRRLTNVEIRTAREGARWHLIEQRPGHYDFTSVQTIVTAAKREGIEVIWDLLHFGWPDWLDIFTPEWVVAFRRFAEAFAKFLNEAMGEEDIWICPINEISFFSWAGGDTAYLNPFATQSGAALKEQLVRGYLAAADAVRAEAPGAKVVAVEPVIHIVGDAKKPRDVVEAAQYRESMFEAWDMIVGRVHPDLGGSPDYIDVIGVNYYPRNQWWNFGKTIWRWEPEYRPFGDILAEVHERYHKPLFVSETGTEDEDRPAWLAYISQEVRNAMQQGVPVHGVCWYPILNHPGWDDDRHCHNGLWDYPQRDGTREVYQPLAEELTRQQRLYKGEFNEISSATQL